MSEHEPVEIPHQYQKRTAATQAAWTRDQLVGHITKREADPEVSDSELRKDIATATRVIGMQAIHLEEPPARSSGRRKNCIKI